MALTDEQIEIFKKRLLTLKNRHARAFEETSENVKSTDETKGASQHPADEGTEDAIRTEVINRLSLYDDRAAIENVEVNPMRSGKGYEINIVADYEGVKGSLTVKVDDTTFANILTETSQ